MCAKIKQGILGGLSGKIGNVVGSSWKGIAVLKTLPLSVANPQTAPQVANRTSFKAAILVGSILLIQMIKKLWDRDAQFQSGYNAFISSNKQAFSDLGVLDVAEFIPTLGKLPETVISSVVIDNGSAVATANWADDTGQGEKSATDIAYVIAFNETKNIWAQSTGGDNRTDESSMVTFSEDMETGNDISMWLMFQGVSAKKIKFKASSELSNTVQ